MGLEIQTIHAVVWLYTEASKVVCVRSRGKDAFYIPGGKYESGETDSEALTREIKEELGVELVSSTFKHLVTVSAPAHGFENPTLVKMKCFSAEFQGQLQPASEIAELAWLSYAERTRCAPAARKAIAFLRTSGKL